VGPTPPYKPGDVDPNTFGSGGSNVAPNQGVVAVGAVLHDLLSRVTVLEDATIEVKATTVNTGAVTVDTGYAPPAGKAAHLDIQYNEVDVANAVTRSGNGGASIRNLGGGGVAIPSGGGTTAPIFGGATGDTTALSTAPTLSVASGTLHVTCTPPGGYSGTIRWVIDITPLENP